MNAVEMRLAVLGDTHFGREDPQVLESLLLDLHATAPEVVVVTGDLTQRARRSEFRRARAFLARLPGKVLAIPGNHDLPLFDVARRLLQPYRRYRHYIDRELHPTLAGPGLTVIGVNATHPLRHKRGVLGRDRIAAAAQRLKQARSRFRMVVVHQPLAVAFPDDLPNLAIGHAAAIEAWVDAGADLLVGGHVHRPYCLAVGARRQAILVQAGTALSTRLRHGEPNSYFLICLTAKGEESRDRRMQIERRDHDAATDRFRPVSRREAEWDPGGWRFGADGPVD